MPRPKRGVEPLRQVRVLTTNSLYEDRKRVIFEQVQAEITPQVIRAYRRVAPLCFGLDRQSMHISREDPSNTSGEARVRAILKIAQRMGFVLPVPERNPDWQPGQLLFEFDRLFWFVDGVRRNATGFSAHPDARPELWRAYTVAHRLREIDPALCPKAFVVGELTRFFRDETWFQQWIDALARMSIEVHEETHGHLDGEKLTLLRFYVKEQSEKFQRDRECSREVRKARGELFHNNKHFGLRWTGPDGVVTPKIRTEVWTEPGEWAILRAMVFSLADGTIPTIEAASQWLFREHGVKRSAVWVSEILRPTRPPVPSILTGVYAKAYSQQCIAARVRTADGMISDLDITSNGHRRYLRDYGQGLHFPIHYTRGTEEAIPLDIYEAACSRVIRRGKPAERQVPDRHGQVILPPHILRCAHCKFGIEERSPRRNRWTGSVSPWRCLCKGVEQYGRLHKLKRDEVRALSREEWLPHPERQNWCASEPLWEAICQELFEGVTSLDGCFPEHQSGADRTEQAHWQEQRQDSLVRMVEIDDRWDAGDYGDPMDDANRASYERRKERERIRYREACGKLQELAEFKLLLQSGNEQFLQLRGRWLRLATRGEDDVTFRREVVLALIQRVDLDMETGAWEATLKVPLQGRRRLRGWAARSDREKTPTERG
jgi:hypothetical protein